MDSESSDSTNSEAPDERAEARESSAHPNMMRLDDVLKRAGLVGSGGQAKLLIQDGQVTVNGVVETRRRKQIFLGDVIETLGETLIFDNSFFES